MTVTGEAAGSPVYMEPEQFEDAKHVDTRADIYSFGIMLYEMACGLQETARCACPKARTPFQTLSADPQRALKELRESHQTRRPPSVSGKHAPLNDIIQWCLAKSATDRVKDFCGLRRELALLFKARTGEEPAPPELEDISLADLNFKGISLYWLGRSAEALDAYDEVLRINPRDERAWSNRGIVLTELRQSEAALDAYERAIRINPRFEQAWFQAEVLSDLGQSQEAMAAHDQALRINPLNPNAWARKGRTLSVFGRNEEALAAFDQALLINPRLGRAWDGKALSLSWYNSGRILTEPMPPIQCYLSQLCYSRHPRHPHPK
jgi:tetratricopeptide (TPR) repeat protein